MLTAPLICVWTGEAMQPLSRFAKTCDAEFVIGERYRLDIIEERSQKSHNQFFAALKDIWDSLPDQTAERFPSQEHLRKFALIKTGFHDSRSIVCSSKAEALRFAAFMRPVDEFAVVVVSEATVTEYRAKSQSQKAMGKQVFQASKEAVLDYAGSLIGVERSEAA